MCDVAGRNACTVFELGEQHPGDVCQRLGDIAGSISVLVEAAWRSLATVCQHQAAYAAATVLPGRCSKLWGLGIICTPVDVVLTSVTSTTCSSSLKCCSGREVSATCGWICPFLPLLKTNGPTADMEGEGRARLVLSSRRP